MSYPPTVVYDPLPAIVEELLGCLEDRLTEIGAPPCRAVWHPGSSVPWDACGTTTAGAEGQAWVAVPRVFPSDNFPAETTDAHRCFPRGYAAEITVGVLRCAATLDEHGRPPPPEDVLADARKQSRDRQASLETIVCCLMGEDADPGIYRLGGWTPLGPDGGCVGGAWTVTVAVDSCRCPDLVEDEGGFGIDPFGTSPFGGE